MTKYIYNLTPNKFSHTRKTMQNVLNFLLLFIPILQNQNYCFRTDEFQNIILTLSNPRPTAQVKAETA
jgi:hypothetical protein